MYQFVWLILLSCFGMATHAQTAADTSQLVYSVVEQMPHFPGGNDSMMRYMNQHLVLPDVLEDISGTVYVKFVVETDGSLSNISIVKPANPDLDKAARLMIAQMPKWIPGTQAGKKVRVTFVVPIHVNFH